MEKRIIRTSKQKEEEQEYDEEARICPECGCAIPSDEMVETATYRVYTCSQCGCKWQVREYVFQNWRA